MIRSLYTRPFKRECISVFVSVFVFISSKLQNVSISVAARSKAWVCGRSLTGIVGSNPAGSVDVSLVSVVFCQVEVCVTS